MFLAAPGLAVDPAAAERRSRSVALPDGPDVATATNPLDLSPARWIWYPSGRTLPNTVVLFRKELDLPSKPLSATGWILGESRYKLNVNRERVQWGPAPSDPRWTEVDPVDLTERLQPGPNVIGAQVLFYGHGEGTWPAGKPGFIFRMDLEMPDGTLQQIVSDDTWHAHLAQAWPRGRYKRWYLRALQEEFDARLYPFGWTQPNTSPAGDWLPAMVLPGQADKPAIATQYNDYLNDTGMARPDAAHLRPRSIPLLHERIVPVARLSESMWISWNRPPEEYFDVLTPDAYEVDRAPAAVQEHGGSWLIEMDGRRAAALTFELEEQIVGWPSFEVEAPEGTVVELLVHEAHEVGGPALLNTHFHAWGRYICREGTTRFEPFDYESLRWLQFHVRNAVGPVRIRNIGVRRRQFPWPYDPHVRCSDQRIEKLAAAAVNTVHNAAQETIVDGMGRERQQYSGDVGHMIHGIHQAFGERRLPARFVTTFSQGMTLDGYFMDSWPAYDRLARIAQRQLGLTQWGPILDHGVQFNFDCWYHYLYSGNLDDVREAYPRLLRFLDYLQALQSQDGLLPAEDLGVPWVWMDNDYRRQRHKQCAFNLYVAAMAENALAPLCRAFGHAERADAAVQFGRSIQKAATATFWSAGDGLFVNNLPWLDEERTPSLCDRSIATAVLFDHCPGGRTGASLDALENPPEAMTMSFPGNANWRLWALAKGRRIHALLEDLRTRFWAMDSVHLNNTLQEHWHVEPDSPSQWSHIPIAPLYTLYMNVAGIRPTAPGYARYEVQPQLGDLAQLELTAYTVNGPILFRLEAEPGRRRLHLTTPPRGVGMLMLDPREEVALEHVPEHDRTNLQAYRLPQGTEVAISLRWT